MQLGGRQPSLTRLRDFSLARLDALVEIFGWGFGRLLAAAQPNRSTVSDSLTVANGSSLKHHRQRLCPGRRWLRDQSRSRLHGNRGAPMAQILLSTQRNSFDPEAISVLSAALEDAWCKN